MEQKKETYLSVKEALVSFAVSVAITLVFFYKVIIGFVPFPGDLLLGEAKPWSTYSYFGYNPGSIPHKAQYPDVIRQLYPWKMLSMDLLKTGNAPLWNPHNFSGTPLLANFQSAPYYPLNLFYFFLSPLTAWTILVMLAPMLALWFTYLYTRKLSVSPVGSWFAGVSYAMSAYMIVILEYNTIGHVTAWLPLILLSIEFLKEKQKASWLFLFIFSLASAALAGHPQLFAYLLAATWIYALVRIRPIKNALFLCVLSLLSIGIAAAQYLPGLELIQNAARSAHDPSELLGRLLIKPWQLLMLPFPNIFGNPATRNYWPADTYAGKVTSIGLVPLFFLPALWRIRNLPMVKFFLATIVVILLFITVNPISNALAYTNIPLWSTSNPTLMTFLLSFALSVGTGIGVDAWTAEKHSKSRLVKRITTVVVGFSVVLLVLFIIGRSATQLTTQIAVANRAIIYGFALSIAVCAVFTVAILRPKFTSLALLFLLFIHVADSFQQFRKFNPIVPASYVYPQAPITEFLREKAGINRVWGYGNALLEPNLATILKLYSTDGYDPLYPRLYGEFINGSRYGIIEEANRSDAMIVPGFGEEDMSSNTNRLRVLDAQGVRYILDRAENASTLKTFPSNRFKLVYEQDGWKIFENLLSAPRAYIAQSIETYTGKEEFSKAFFRPEFDPRTTVLVETSAKLSLSKPQGGTAEIISYLPNEVRIVTETSTDSLLFLSDTYYPGWRAFVDTTETPIIKTDYAFRGVLVPSGSHTVIFQYEPDSFKTGKTVSFIFLLVTAIVLMRTKRMNKT